MSEHLAKHIWKEEGFAWVTAWGTAPATQLQWPQEHEAAGHTVSVVQKQRGVDRELRWRPQDRPRLPQGSTLKVPQPSKAVYQLETDQVLKHMSLWVMCHIKIITRILLFTLSWNPHISLFMELSIFQKWSQNTLALEKAYFLKFLRFIHIVTCTGSLLLFNRWKMSHHVSTPYFAHLFINSWIFYCHK